MVDFFLRNHDSEVQNEIGMGVSVLKKPLDKQMLLELHACVDQSGVFLFWRNREARCFSCHRCMTVRILYTFVFAQASSVLACNGMPGLVFVCHVRVMGSTSTGTHVRLLCSTSCCSYAQPSHSGSIP